MTAAGAQGSGGAGGRFRNVLAFDFDLVTHFDRDLFGQAGHIGGGLDVHRYFDVGGVDDGRLVDPRRVDDRAVDDFVRTIAAGLDAFVLVDAQDDLDAGYSR
jgi:hypothetical protein